MRISRRVFLVRGQIVPSGLDLSARKKTFNLKAKVVQDSM